MAVSVGTYASIPGAPSTGDLHFLTDSFYTVLHYNGASWDHFYSGKLLSIPNSGSFSWVNQGAASITTTNGGIHLATPAAAGDNLRIRVKSAPSTPYTVTACLVMTLAGANYAQAGLVWRESGSGKLISVFLAEITPGMIGANKNNSETSYNSTYFTLLSDILVSSQLIWLRIEDDGSNRKIHYSCDGINFLQVHSVGRTDFITADQIGWYVNANNATYAARATLIHWAEA